MSDELLFICTHAQDDPERALLPFIAANTAAVAGLPAVVLLTIDGVWLGTVGMPEKIEKEGFPPLASVYEEFIGNGGEIWLCGTCAKPRGITEDRLVPGAKITGAANIIEHIVAGAKPISFT
jgi:predicted peroxiredoxin